MQCSQIRNQPLTFRPQPILKVTPPLTARISLEFISFIVFHLLYSEDPLSDEAAALPPGAGRCGSRFTDIAFAVNRFHS